MAISVAVVSDLHILVVLDCRYSILHADVGRVKRVVEDVHVDTNTQLLRAEPADFVSLTDRHYKACQSPKHK